jgi:Tfp pilus assembly protein PilF
MAVFVATLALPQAATAANLNNDVENAINWRITQGLSHSQQGDYNKAYELLAKAKQLSAITYGANHARTQAIQAHIEANSRALYQGKRPPASDTQRLALAT